MAIYIESSSGEVFYMDAVVDISYTQSGNPTQYAMESGVNSSDHYDQQQDILNIRGYVSEVKFARTAGVTTDLETFEKGITSLKKSGQFFTVAFSDYLNVLDNCLFTSLVLQRTPETGTHALSIQMGIQQQIVADRVEVATAPTPADLFKDVVETKKSSSSNVQNPSETEVLILDRSLDSLGIAAGGLF